MPGSTIHARRARRRRARQDAFKSVLAVVLEAFFIVAIDSSVDPRVLRTHDAVLGAAGDVLREEGWEQVTVRRIAERSGYARTTLYRHLPKRLDQLRDLIREEGRLSRITPTGDLLADLAGELEAFRVAVTERGLGGSAIARVRGCQG